MRFLGVAAPSIVSISNFKSVNGEDIAEGTGSGIVWDTYGHIVTNYHCIARLARDTTGSQVRDFVQNVTCFGSLRFVCDSYNYQLICQPCQRTVLM